MQVECAGVKLHKGHVAVHYSMPYLSYSCRVICFFFCSGYGSPSLLVRILILETEIAINTSSSSGSGSASSSRTIRTPLQAVVGRYSTLQGSLTSTAQAVEDATARKEDSNTAQHGIDSSSSSTKQQHYAPSYGRVIVVSCYLCFSSATMLASIGCVLPHPSISSFFPSWNILIAFYRLWHRAAATSQLNHSQVFLDEVQQKF